MKILQNKFLQSLIVIFIGAAASFYIFKIASINDDLILLEYYDRMIVIFITVIAAMALSSFVTRKRK